MTKFEIKMMADMLCYKFKKAGITWAKRYVDESSKGTYRRTKLYIIDVDKFLESDLPGYLKRKKIKYTLILADKSKFRMTDSIAFYLYY